MTVLPRVALWAAVVPLAILASIFLTSYTFTDTSESVPLPSTTISATSIPATRPQGMVFPEGFDVPAGVDSYDASKVPGLTATPSPEPPPPPPPPSAPPAPPVIVASAPLVPSGDVEAAFFQGYRDAGGAYDEAHIWRVINCESRWGAILAPGQYHWGLAQFAPGTWWNVAGRTGLTDWTNPYHQGYNMAVWASLINPGSTAGWPVCWWS